MAEDSRQREQDRLQPDFKKGFRCVPSRQAAFRGGAVLHGRVALREDNVWRQTLAANVRLGFKIPAFVPKPIVRNVRKNRQEVEVAVGAK